MKIVCALVPAEGQLSYFARDAGSIKPLRPALNFKRLKPRIALLWGDPLYVIRIDGGKALVSAKGHHLELPVADLMDTPLLSLYQVDVGQGDSALVNLPDGRWMMVDGGPSTTTSNTGKVAADFLEWKMFVDQSWRKEFGFGGPRFRLDAVVCTHPDEDHFGGFRLLDDKLGHGTLELGTVFHCGLGRFSGKATAYSAGKGFSQLGPVSGGALPEAFVTTLIDGFGDVRELAAPTPQRAWHLDGDYARWLQQLAAREGAGVGALQRAHHAMGHLPGFAPAAGAASVAVLGPVEEDHGGPALRYIDGASESAMKSPSLTRNGHSVVLRLDYGKVRIALTGDLNFRAQTLLLEHVPEAEFRCHVAKACHHGSEDISTRFLKAMSPLATLISSGDNEQHVHPRALMVGLTGLFSTPVRTGTNSFLGHREEKLAAPLIYSTELSRSIELFDCFGVFDRDGDRVRAASLQAAGRTRRADGPRAPSGDWLLGDRMVYGLINVRSDGSRVLFGVLKEADEAFHTDELVI